MRLWHVTAVLALTLSIALWGLWQQRKEVAAATLRATTAEALVEGYQARLDGLQKATLAGQDRSQRFKEVLDESPEWRDAAVPGPVADGLCQHLRCK